MPEKDKMVSRAGETVQVQHHSKTILVYTDATADNEEEQQLLLERVNQMFPLPPRNGGGYHLPNGWELKLKPPRNDGAAA